MSELRNFTPLICMLLVTVVLSAVAGCGNSRPVAQVKGKVVFVNGAAPNAGMRMIRFECAEDTDAAVRKGAASTIAEDGSFELYTRRQGDGVHLGKYDVTFAICQGPMDQRSLIPTKYTKSHLTPYHVLVDDDKDDLIFEIDLKDGSTAK